MMMDQYGITLETIYNTMGEKFVFDKLDKYFIPSAYSLQILCSKENVIDFIKGVLKGEDKDKICKRLHINRNDIEALIISLQIKLNSTPNIIKDVYSEENKNKIAACLEDYIVNIIPSKEFAFGLRNICQDSNIGFKEALKILYEDDRFIEYMDELAYIYKNYSHKGITCSRDVYNMIDKAMDNNGVAKSSIHTTIYEIVDSLKLGRSTAGGNRAKDCYSLLECNRIITDRDINILSDYNSEKYTVSEIKEKYGVSQSRFYHILLKMRADRKRIKK